jgi:diguanylate cyclase (GGDEF)-like protein/PAS domain S-box-containing protein
MNAGKPKQKNNQEHESGEYVFQLMFEKHSVVMLLIEPKSGLILDANQAAVDFYGYSKTKLCSMFINEINTMPLKQVEEERKKALHEERNYFIFTHRLANGEERAVEVHSSPIALKEKKVLFSIIHDITDRKKMEAALRESEEKTRSIIEYATNGITLTDEQGFVVEWNPAQADIMGLARNEVIGCPLWDVQFQIMCPERRTLEVYEKFRAHFLQMLSTGEIPEHIREQEVKILKANKTVQFVQSVVFSIKTTQGFRLAGISHDITEHKKLEQELQNQRDFATQIISAMGQGVTVTNEEGRFEFVNPAYANLFGYETSDLIGKFPEDVTVPEDHELLSEQRMARRSGKTTSYESKLRRSDGSIAQVLITGVPREQNGRYEGAIAVITDLTTQKKIEEELRRTRDELVILHSELEKSYMLEKQIARIDTLTGINNRRSLFEFAERELNIAIRYQQALSMILFDIDHFKQINDTYGHLAGDQVLTCVAQTISRELRSMDVIGRYGGDEFIILLPQTSSLEAIPLTERIHASVSKIQIEFNSRPISVTISIGVTQVQHNIGDDTQVDTIEKMILRADKALYVAKQAERNRTKVLDTE